jgi:hypothetical protein
MSILRKIKDRLSSTAQKALGIDGIRYSLQVALEKLERIHEVESKLAELQCRSASIEAKSASIETKSASIETKSASIEAKSASIEAKSASIEAKSASIEAKSATTSNQIQNLKTFLTWYSNRVEPWFWTGNFSQTDPEEELAGFLFNFLSGHILLHFGSASTGFVKAATEIGYEVHSLELPNSIGALAASESLPKTADFLNITLENVDPETVKEVDSIRPEVIQVEFIDKAPKSGGSSIQEKAPISASELIKELRSREYYWNGIIFRTEAEGFIRMGTNLASGPNQAWGKMLFFRDHQLFLKAFHWCKTTLPRFRAAPLAR